MDIMMIFCVEGNKGDLYFLGFGNKKDFLDFQELVRKKGDNG